MRNLVLFAIFLANRGKCVQRPKCQSVNVYGLFATEAKRVQREKKDRLDFPGVRLKPLSHLSTSLLQTCYDLHAVGNLTICYYNLVLFA